MAVQRGSRLPLPSTTPIAVELAIVTAMLVGLSLWQRLLRRLADPLTAALDPVPSIGVLPAGGLLTSALFLAGLALVVGTYAGAREIHIGLTVPSGADLPLLGLAGAAPIALVGATALVGTATGVPYRALAMTSYGADAPLGPILEVVTLGLLVGVPSLVLVAQVLVQGTLGRVLDATGTVVLTTLVTGLVLLSNTGGLTAVPDTGKLIGAGLLVAGLAIASLGADAGRDWLRYLLYLPVVLFVALVVVTGIAGTESVADALFTGTHLAVLAVAAATYERSRSLLVPAVAYLSLSLSTTAVLLLDAGLLPV